MTTHDEAASTWLVACLCAEWCHVCQDDRAVFEQLAGEFAEVAAFVRVDIEDDEDALGGVEVDDFPTLLIAHGSRVCHFAPVVSSAAGGRRLVGRALAGELATLGHAALAGLAGRLCALHRARG